MGTTTNFAWDYGTRRLRPYWDVWTTLMQAVDTDLSLVKGGIVNVKEYGAVGDGVTDDTAAIQAAINSFVNGGIVFIPVGTYLTSSTITIGSNIHLMGSGTKSSILNYTGTTKAFYIDVTSDTISPVIEKFKLNAGGYVGIEVESTNPHVMTKARLSDLYLLNVSRGIYLHGNAGTQIFGNQFRDIIMSGVTEYGIKTDTCGVYNEWDGIEITSVGDSAYAIYNQHPYNVFTNIRTDGVIYDQGASTWIRPTIETINATTPPVNVAFQIINGQVIGLQLSNIDNAKCSYGLSLSGVVTVIGYKTIGTDYPNYPLALVVGSSGLIIDSTTVGGYTSSQSMAASILANWTFINSPTLGGDSILKSGMATEEITLSLVGATTDSSANLLPVTSTIDYVTYYVTETITGVGVTGFTIGDAGDGGRFTAAITDLVAGTKGVGMTHLAVATLAIAQVAAAKLRITVAGALPTAGKIRVLVYYKQVQAPSAN